MIKTRVAVDQKCLFTDSTAQFCIHSGEPTVKQEIIAGSHSQGDGTGDLKTSLGQDSAGLLGW